MLPAKTGNINWINNIRLAALYAIIIVHSSAPLLMQYGKVPAADWWSANILNSLSRFGVPVFLMVTGALLLQKEYDTVDFLKKRITRVVAPFLFWSLIYVWYSWYNEEITFGGDAWANVKQVLHLLKNGTSYHLWYVYMLIGLYFFIPVIGKYVRNSTEKDVRYFLIVWFGVMMLSQPYLVRYNPSVDMHYFAGYAGYLVLGHYLAYKDFGTKNLRQWIGLLFICSVTIIAVGTWLIVAYTKMPGAMLYEPVNPAILMLATSIFIWFKLTVPKVSPVIISIRDFAGNYNYGIYLGHALVLYFLDDPLGISYKMGQPFLSIPATAFVCLMITLPLVWIINKIPFGKWVSG
jgi:surface polysaccharide O-acyltransferase-like enzyme